MLEATEQPRFLIIIPRFVNQPGEQYIFPVGIGYISAVLKSTGNFVVSLDLNRFAGNVDQIISDHIRQHSINVVATGAISIHYNKVKNILAAVRSISSDIITIVGGGVISSEPELIFHSLGIDFGVLGEGEETIVELAAALFTSQDLSGIAGLIHRTSAGQIVITPERKPIRKLDDLPFPDDDFLDGFYESQPRIYNLVSSRSCPFGCTFCYHPIGRVYRQRSLDDVFREVEYSFNRFHPFYYRVIDELFSHKKERLIEFCNRIKPYKVSWDVQMRVCDVDEDLIRLMRESGCALISYGLESGSQHVLDSMRKKTKVAEIVRAVDITYRGGIQVQGAYIFGDAAETRHTAVETISLWLRQRHIGIGMWPIELYPGTPLYHSAVKRGIIKDRLEFVEKGCPAINVSKLTDAEALRLSLLMYLVVITYNTVPAEIISCSPSKAIPDGSGKPVQRFNIAIVCPHCNAQQVHENYPMYNKKKWTCHECQRRFDVQPLSQWRHWPRTFDIAREYAYKAEDSDALLRFFDTELSPCTVPDLPGYSEVDLLGNTYLIPSNFSLHDIRYGLMQIFFVDRESQRLDPVVIYDNHYKRLHHPWYLRARITELVDGWNENGVKISIVGIEPEIQNLFEWTNIADAAIDSVVLLDHPDATQLASGNARAIRYDDLVKDPPDVILVTTTKTQRSLCEQLALQTSVNGTEVTALYSSGTNF